MATTDMPQLTAQVHQFDRNPGRGESLLAALYAPSATAVASYTSAENRAHSGLAANPGGPGGAVANAGWNAPTTTPPSVAYSSTAHRDYVRNASDSASIVH